MKKIKLGLFPKVVIAIVVGALLGLILPDVIVRLFKTFNVLFAQLLKFVVPLLVLGLVTPSIANLGRGAGKMLLTVMLIAYCSTVIGALSLTPAFAQSDTLRILGVGNSWTRDSMRWLSAIASSAGRPVIVGHAYNGGVRPSSQAEWDDLHERMHHHIQKEIRELADHMGNDCSFIINVGQAIYDARRDSRLSSFGYRLQRTQNNTHLAEGFPMYIASLCYAYVILDIERDDVTFYPKSSEDSHLTGDTGSTVRTRTSATASLAARARKCAWKASKEL